jgi:hypothetical protein
MYTCDLKHLCNLHGGCSDPRYGECDNLVDGHAFTNTKCYDCNKYDCNYTAPKPKEKKQMNFYNVRDAKGRFTKNGSSSTSTTIATPVVTVCQAVVNKKEDFLATLRTTEVMVTHERHGQTVINTFTLKPDYLSGYVGKGNSSKAPSDLIYAYDVDEKRFKTIDVTKVSSFIPL